MDTAQWPQEIVVKPIEEIVTNTCPKAASSSERKIRPQKEHVINCPRCNSTNTKFCYYNNYSLTQPRYFCKTCRRYWTEGGSLRNIPVGGGSRKNKRSSSSSSQSPSISTTPLLSSSKKLPGLVTQNPNSKIHDGQDLNLAFPRGTTISELVHIPIENNNNKNNQIPSSCSSSPSVSQLSALELLTGVSSRGFNSFIPMPVQDPNNVYTSGFPMQDQFKPTLNFSLDGLGTGSYGGLHGVQDQTSTGRLLFPFEDLKHVSNNTTDIEPNKGQADSAGYWTGMLGGGSW